MLSNIAKTSAAFASLLLTLYVAGIVGYRLPDAAESISMAAVGAWCLFWGFYSKSNIMKRIAFVLLLGAAVLPILPTA